MYGCSTSTSVGGPNGARTTIDRNLVVCFLGELLTKGERRLIADGKSEAVLEMRRGFQEAMRDNLVSEVERATGRRVIAFMSANNLDPDHAIESFVLDGPVAARWRACRKERTLRPSGRDAVGAGDHPGRLAGLTRGDPNTFRPAWRRGAGRPRCSRITVRRRRSAGTRIRVAPRW